MAMWKRRPVKAEPQSREMFVRTCHQGRYATCHRGGMPRVTKGVYSTCHQGSVGEW